MENNQPWINQNGSVKDIEELKVLSRSWSPKTWENYLKSIETKQSSYEISFGEIMNSFSNENTLGDFISSSLLEELPRLEKILKQGISVKQKEVLQAYFVDGRSEYQIAEEMDISRRTVRTHKERAISKIKFALGEKVKSINFFNENHGLAS